MRNQHSVTIKIDKPGRDLGKEFVLTPLSAWDAEELAGRALFAMMNAGINIPENILDGGLSGLAALGIRALSRISFEQAKPLLDQLMSCVDVKASEKVIRPLLNNDAEIQEVSTLLTLRKEVIKLHLDFFMNGAGSTLG